MFAVHDHSIQLAGEPLPRDIGAAEVRARIAAGAALAPPRVGTVYAALLNDRRALPALDAAFHAAPYHKPPSAPILYVKPRNTLVGHGASVRVPQDAPGLCIGGSLGILIGRVASRVTAARALDYVAGYLIVADLSVPNNDFFRLPVRDLIRDGFCVLGPSVVAARHVPDPDAIKITIETSGQSPFKASTADCVRSAAQLLADVSDFMTLAPGDVLTLGVPWGAPVAHAGDTVSVDIGGWPPLRFTLAADGDATR